jgi:hypothetical protein
MSRYFAALDAGRHGITAVAARWNKNRDFVLEGFCHTRSKGFHRGTVADAAIAADSVSETLNKLREKTGKKIHDVYVGVSSGSVGIIPSSGVLLLSKYGREVTETDVKKCVEIGSTVKTPLDKEPLHRIVCGFSIDGEKEIKNPLNLEGVKLEVSVNVLTINSSVLRNMSACISQAGFICAGFVFLGLASAYRVLTEEDRETGVTLLDIRSDLTEVMVFYRGILNSCKVFPVGTNEILMKDGGVNAQGLEKLISRIVSLVGWEKTRKVVVIGEGALIDSLIESLEGVFALPVTAGTCISRPFEHLPPERTGYVGSLGILDYLQQEKHKQRLSGNIIKRGFNRTLGFIDRYF